MAKRRLPRVARPQDAPPAPGPAAARLLVALGLLALLGANAWSTWGRWGDVITDCGRELDVALQLSRGRALYSEVRFWYGPLPAYLNALLFRAWGASVDTLAAAGLACAALLAALGYRMVRLFAGRLPAWAAAAALLQACAFVQLYPNNIFNFVVPYACAATYGISLALASVFFLVRHALDGRRRDLWLAAATLGLVALCKLEPLFAALVAHGTFLVVVALRERTRVLARLPPYLAALALPAAVYGSLWARLGPALLADNLLLVAGATAGDYALSHAGLLDPGDSLRQLLISLAGGLLVLAGGALLARQAERFAAELPAQGPARALALGGVALVSGGLTAGLVLALGPLRLFRALPLALLAGLVLARRNGRSAQPAGRALALAVLCAFGLGALPRIVLRAGAEHYGFYLLVPGLVALAVLLAGEWPQWVAPGGRVVATATATAFLLAAASGHAGATAESARAAYGQTGLTRASGPRGALPLPVPYVGTVDEAVRYLAEAPRNSRVLVVPQGVGMTFLAGLENPLGVHTFLPLDFGGGWSEQRVVAQLAAAAPDYVVVTAADTSEFGKQGFGIDYGLDLARWISARYAPLRSWRSPYYQVSVLGRRPRPAP